MTQSIDRETREQVRRAAAATPPHLTQKCARTLVGIRVFTAATTIGAVTLGVLAGERSWEQVHFVIGSATCIILATIGGSLLCLRMLLAGRQEVYRHGLLDGWYRGWNGRPPDGDAPGLG